MTKRKISSIDELSPVRAYLRRIGAEVRSMRTAIVKEVQGNYWQDIATVRFNRDGTIAAPLEQAPTSDEAFSIKKAIEEIEFPRLVPLSNPLLSPNLPPEVKEAKPENVFLFTDADSKTVMLQLRVNTASGKCYFPWTYWDDDLWRQMEPEGKLPLWGLDQLIKGGRAVVFVHEGAKAARSVREMVEQKTPEAIERFRVHPWGRDLEHAAHLGWIGGALNPSRTDWSVIAKYGVQTVYIVSDNDKPGFKSAKVISKHLNLPTFRIQFTNEWPISFDLADPFPKNMFQTTDKGVKQYIGPTFRDLLHPATWATDMVPSTTKSGNPGKLMPVLRESFKHTWSYVESVDMFVCNSMPEIMLTEQIFNKALAAYCDVNNLSQLLVRASETRISKLCYRPDITGRIITDKGTSAINLHVPGTINPVEGDATPFLEFMTYLFPDKDERNVILRWCATLISKPMIRMHYGLLLVTSNHGIGKTTLASAVLAPLVGSHNVGWPTETDVTRSEFNSWLVNKRLVVMSEIHDGDSAKAYNKLKTIITDTEISINQKHQITYTLENWVHVIACSNSSKALKMEADDRRWFYPQVTDNPWPRWKFVQLRTWLLGGGLSIIKHWSDNYVKGNGVVGYIETGERPLLTKRKEDLIDASRPKSISIAMALGEAIIEMHKPVVLSIKDVVEYIRRELTGNSSSILRESNQEILIAMKEVGIHVWPNKIKIGIYWEYVVMSKEALQAIEDKTDAISALLELRRPISEVIEVTM